MLSVFRFEVEIPPMGKARPRMTRNGHVYTPKETVEAERAVRDAFIAAGGRQIEADVPVYISVFAVFAIPKSWPKWKRTAAMAGAIRPTKKPDTDNIGKLVADALNGAAYADDSQIVEMYVSKSYSPYDGAPYIGIEIGGFE